MAGTINYLYDPQQTIWVIESSVCNGANVLSVRKGVIIQVIGSVLSTGQSLLYSIKIEGTAGTFSFVETDVFTDLATATTEYEVRLT
jgi:hypothetical protein